MPIRFRAGEGDVMRHYYELLALSDAELAKIDPIVINLLVAKGIPV